MNKSSLKFKLARAALVSKTVNKHELGGAGSDFLTFCVLVLITPFTLGIPLIIWLVYVIFVRKDAREELRQIRKNGHGGGANQQVTIVPQYPTPNAEPPLTPSERKVRDLEAQLRIVELENALEEKQHAKRMRDAEIEAVKQAKYDSWWNNQVAKWESDRTDRDHWQQGRIAGAS